MNHRNKNNLWITFMKNKLYKSIEKANKYMYITPYKIKVSLIKIIYTKINKEIILLKICFKEKKYKNIKYL